METVAAPMRDRQMRKTVAAKMTCGLRRSALTLPVTIRQLRQTYIEVWALSVEGLGDSWLCAVNTSTRELITCKLKPPNTGRPASKHADGPIECGVHSNVVRCQL